MNEKCDHTLKSGCRMTPSCLWKTQMFKLIDDGQVIEILDGDRIIRLSQPVINAIELRKRVERAGE